MRSLVFAVVVLVAVEAVDLGNILKPAKRQGNSDSYVAFSAGLTKTTSIAANITLKFDKVWTNTANGYDNTTGVFTCPHTGVYNFVYHALTETRLELNENGHSAGTMWVDLYKNGDYQVTGYAHNAQDYAAASNSIILALNQGDTVYLRARGTDQIYGMTDEIYATFSGFLLLPQGV